MHDTIIDLPTFRPNLSFFPPEIIDLFICYVLAVSHKSRRSALNAERHHFASCGLISKAFYLPSRQHLFGTISITIDGRVESQSRILKLKELLLARPILQEQIRHLHIEYHVHEHPEEIEGLESDNPFDHIAQLLPALRKLTISNGLDHPVDYVPELLSPVGDLRIFCPYLQSLRIHGLHGVPHEFIQQWTNISDLQIDGVSLLDWDDYASDMDESNEDSVNSERTPFRRLERVSLVNVDDLPSSPSILSPHHLQYLHLSFRRGGKKHALSALEDDFDVLRFLSLHFAFFYPPPYSFSIAKFPSLQVLQIHETLQSACTYWTTNSLPLIAHFLTPKVEMVLNLQSIHLSFKGVECSHTIISNNAAARWSALDRACTSHQYEHLRDVKIRIELVHSRKYEKQWGKRIRDGLNNCVPHFLPLLSSSPSINLEFSVRLQLPHRLIVGGNNDAAVQSALMKTDYSPQSVLNNLV